MNSFPFPILALDFLSPWLLWGVGLGSLPVILHLLHKRKFRETSWAAMQFLLEAARKNSRRIRLEQLILLMVRVLILVLLALALAQPVVESTLFQVSATVPRHRILVIDTSFSMGHQPAESSRLDQAKTIAQQIVSSAARGDAFNLVRISESMPRIIVQEPSYQMGAVLKEIENLSLTDERGELTTTLAAVGELLQKAPELERKEVYFLSDFQQSSWGGDSETQRTQLTNQLKALSEDARLVCIDLGQDPAPNAAIKRFLAEELPATISRPVRLLVTVENFDGVGPTQRSVELYVDGRFAEKRIVELTPNSDVETDFSYTFQTGGEHQLEVRLDGDALEADNRRWLALPVREALNILLVNGTPAGRVTEEATYYLEKALSPSNTHAESQNPVQMRVISDGELTGVELADYDCVLLANVAMFTQREADLLKAFAQNGGGLVFSLGDAVNADNYNRFLYQDGNGILPVRLTDRTGNAENPQEVFTFLLDDLSHPIMNPFQGNPNTGLENALTFSYFTVEVPAENAPQVALRFHTGDPAILDAPLGRGRTILLTTSLDDKWSTWTTLGGASFVPVMHETLKRAVAGRWAQRQHTIGDSISRVLFDSVVENSLSMKSPDGKEHALRISTEDNFSRFNFDATQQRGVYELHPSGPVDRVEYFAVNVDPRESRLRKISEEGLKETVLSGVNFSHLREWRGFRTESDVETTGTSSLTQWLLTALLCLIFVEQLMAWRFTYGLMLLYGLVALAFVRTAFVWNFFGGLTALLLFSAGMLLLIIRPRNRGQDHTASHIRS